LLTLGYAYETLGKMQDELQEKFKSTALPRLLEFMFHQFNYLPNQRIARSTLVESQLISYEIKTDGTLWATGENVAGELGKGDTNNRNRFTQTGF
jgi:hypothetical protein